MGRLGAQLDWMALRGINLALAWIGVEKIFIEVFRDVGFTDSEISSFVSGRLSSPGTTLVTSKAHGEATFLRLG